MTSVATSLIGYYDAYTQAEQVDSNLGYRF
jgi:hypothetical protein